MSKPGHGQRIGAANSDQGRGRRKVHMLRGPKVATCGFAEWWHYFATFRHGER